MQAREQPISHADVRQLAERMARAWMQQDIATIVGLFTDDGCFIWPGGSARGHTEIEKAVAKFFAHSGGVKVAIKRVLIDGAAGAIEWTWQETKLATGERRTMEDAIIFELRGGKVAYWREYFDPRQTKQV
jgi:uncharacterized protein (TIGR02246 family)